ncbi:hypothetical protein ACFO9E_00185 [Streptomyces maoxianensis]|uniref:Uncharacterized protein n=1 Tax=Streptomyces maoxianensis TaxID=1459942 RepID=A0ABV9FYI5_9ACTN
MFMEAIAVQLLMALAGSAAGAAGQQAWQSLRVLVLRRSEGDQEGEGAGGEDIGGLGELTALAEEPGDEERAHALAAALAARAGRDPGFAQRLQAWRQEAEAERGVRTGAGDVRNEFSGTAHGPVVMGRDFHGPINFG